MKANQILSFGLGLLLAFPASSFSQTIFTYGGHPVSAQEFQNVYQKNNLAPNQAQTSMSDYLNLYALYKMKVQEAKDLRMDTLAAVQKELNDYKAQLTRSELVDKAVTQRLVKEAYERSKTDVNVSHILIAVRRGEDSTRALHLIDSLYGVLSKDNSHFADFAQKYSEDKTTSDQGGAIGWIRPLQTPYEFETAAYNTAKGQISKPFRTIYGYDIVKVNDRQQDPGQLEVAQILITSPDYLTPEEKQKKLELVQTAESKLKAGADFADMVHRYSEDKFTLDNDGVMKPFGVGDLTPAFENAAFALKNPGDISQPVKTEYGYHIIKLIKKIPFQPFDSVEDVLTSKVLTDPREAQAKDAYVKQIKAEYQFQSHPEALKQLSDQLIADTGKTLDFDKYSKMSKPLFSIEKQTFTQGDFANYLQKIINGQIVGNKQKVLDNLYNSYESQQIAKFQQDKLLSSRPDLQAMVQEYKDGILLFDLMDQKIWSKASSDPQGLSEYYENHKDKYVWEPSFEGVIVYSASKGNIEELQKLVKDGDEIITATNKVAENTKDITPFETRDGRFTFESLNLNPQALKEGQVTNIFSNPKDASKPYGVAYVRKIYQNITQKSFPDARGFVVADYQDYLEKQWEKELLTKYPLKINDKVLKSMESKK